MKTLAAVLVETGKPLELCELEIPPLKSGQVLVEIAFSGVCHTQLLECRGYRGKDTYLPHCLGHEGSGTVCEIGPDVKKVKAGDAVILSWIKGSGADVPGTVYSWNGKNVNAGAITTFSRFSVISENRLTPAAADGFSAEETALFGCAIPTGFGAVLNSAQAKAGQGIAIFGVGGIGFSALLAAKTQGLNPILAIDLNEKKLESAKNYGATHCLIYPDNDLLKKIFEICPKGADIAIEASGKTEAMKLALECVRNQGGTAVIIGNARHGEKLTLDPKQFNLGKRLVGTWGGDSFPDRDFSRYIDLIAKSQVKLDPYLSNIYPLGKINQALDALESGKALRPLIDMSLSPSPSSSPLACPPSLWREGEDLR